MVSYCALRESNHIASHADRFLQDLARHNAISRNEYEEHHGHNACKDHPSLHR